MAVRRLGAVVAPVWLLGLLLASAAATAQDDREAERAARRQQLQLQSLQQQVSDAKAEKVKAEQQQAETELQLRSRGAAAAQAQAALRKLQGELGEARAANEALNIRIAAADKSLADQKAAAEKEAATHRLEVLYVADLLTQTDSRSRDWHTRYDQTVDLVRECVVKNDRLYQLSAELTRRYRNKGVVDAMRQREPVLGLRDVEIFNEVQAYRDQATAERFNPNARQP